MKIFFSRIENWLLIAPLILLFIEWVFIGQSVFDVHLHDTYFVMPGSSPFILILLLLFIPYFCHIILKPKGQTIRIIHLISTVVLILVFFISLKLIPTNPRRYYDFSSWNAYKQFGIFNSFTALTIIAFLIAQLFFITYTIIRLLLNNKNATK
jgi:cytochrome c oxidase subunit I